MGFAYQEVEQYLKGLGKSSWREELAKRVKAKSEERTRWAAMSFQAPRFRFDGPQADLVRAARGHRQNSHQHREFFGIDHMRRLQIEASRFQRSEQRLDFPPLAINRQSSLGTASAGDG